MSASLERDAAPALPLWRLLLALAFVPGVYLVLAATALLALAVAAGLVYGIYYLFWEVLHWVSLKFAIIAILIGIGGIYTVFAVLVGACKSLWPRHSSQPALILDMSQEPRLRRFIEELCRQLGCRVPDTVLLSGEPSFHVQQARVHTFSGRTKGRLLTLGCPLLGGLTVSELRSVLAHEFAHFTGRDTLYSAFVLPLYVGIESALEQMGQVVSQSEESESAGWMSIPMFLPAWVLGWYVTTFHKLNASLSRLRETRADIIAAIHSGSDSFASALRKVVRQGTLYSVTHGRHITDRLAESKAFVNYYQFFRELVQSNPDALDTIEKRAMADTGGPDDFHPPLEARLASLPDQRDQHPDARPARQLLAAAQQKEETLTKLYTHLLAQTAVFVKPPEEGEIGEQARTSLDRISQIVREPNEEPHSQGGS